MQLTLYVRRDCHLCAEMHADLERVRERYGFSLELVEIDTDSDLVQQYDHKVPVLVEGDYEICHYFLDHPQLAQYMEGRR